MAASAVIALKYTFGEPAVYESILSFLDDSSHIAVCGTDATDIADVAELDGFFVNESTYWINRRISLRASMLSSYYYENLYL